MSSRDAAEETTAVTSRAQLTLGYITIAQVVGCVLVVFGHSYPYDGIPIAADRLRDFVYSFHMPLFIWASGYLAAVTRASARYGTRQYVARRAKRLLTPYIALSLIGLAPKVVFAEVLNDPLTLDAQSVVEAFLVPRLNVWGHFWFLPTIFIIGIIGFGVDRLLSRTSQRNAVLIVVVILSGVLTFLPPLTPWFAVNDVKEFLFYYLLGMLTAAIRPAIESLGSGVGAATGLAAVAVFFVGGAPSRILVAVLMITSVVAFSVAASARVRIPRDALLAQTYSIFILSWPFQLIAEVITEKILGLDFSFVMAAMFSAGMFLPMVTIRLIDAFERVTNTRFLSLVIGR